MSRVYFGRTAVGEGDVPGPHSSSTQILVGTCYHWGIGFKYGATEDVFAVAIVNETGMEVWWYHDGWAGSGLPVGWYYDEYRRDPASGLTHSGNPANWSAPVKDLFAEHFPDVSRVYFGRAAIGEGGVPAPRGDSTLLVP